MKILIVNPPIRLTDKPRHIPHGLAILANIIRKRFDCQIRFIDWNAHRYSEEKFKSLIKDYSCDIALIGGLIPVYKYLIRISNIIKGYHPKCKVIAGGSAAMSVPETLLENADVDVVCTGEGEVTIVELIEVLKEEKKPDLSKIQGIAYRAEKDVIINPQRPLIKNLDIESDMPAYDLLAMDIYLANQVIGLGKDIDFISGRGCPFHCTFCYQPWGKKNRCHSADFLTDSILYLKKKYQINFVSFQDDLFIANKKRLYEFCEQRNKYFPDIYWSCTGRANICDEELVQTIRMSGCTLVSYGFESGSPRMLGSMKKNISLHQMEEVVRLNRKYGFPIPVSFILGMPGEDTQSCNETVDFCLNNNLTLDSLMYATPYPGTELFDFSIKTGRIKKEGIHDFVMQLGDAREFVINLTDAFTDQELQDRYKKMISKTKLAYQPIPQDEIEEKIRSLYGSLSDNFFSLSPEDRVHKAKHGAVNIF